MSPGQPGLTRRARTPPASLAEETDAVVPTIQESGGSIMFGRRFARFAMPAALGSILLLAAPAWAQTGTRNEKRVGDTGRTGQAGNVNKTNNAAANAAVRPAEADLAVRTGTYGERNANINGRSLPYGGFGTSYYGYA